MVGQLFLFFIFLFGAFVCLVFLIGVIVNRRPRYKVTRKRVNRPIVDIDPSFDDLNQESERERAGKVAEKQAYNYIVQVKTEDDIILNNVEFVYNNQRCEIDYVVINKYGVFIIEVKYYSGYIEGDSNSRVWSKTKITSYGNTYVKQFNSPLKQLNWHVDSLAKYLRENGIHVWVKGYSMILNNEHSQVDSEQVLHNTEEIDIAIHTRALENKYELSKSKIDKIIGLLNNRL